MSMTAERYGYTSVAPAYQHPVPALRTTNPQAILSMILSLLSFFTFFTAIPGVILGHIALADIKRNPAQEGRGMAIIGLVIGYVVLALPVVLIVGTAILIALGVTLLSIPG
jgi:peptidyl-prolyl cis-trans isomerase B (cyclophilin B)